MEQIYRDTLETIVIYKYDLDAIVFDLHQAQQRNFIMYCVVAALVLAVIVSGVVLIRKYRKKMEQEKLTKRLLSRQAGNLPLLTDKVNKISSKSIKLSAALYDELQQAINDVKTENRSGIVDIVNDSDFTRQYPFLKEMDFLSPYEKIVLIFTEEEYPLQEIALYIGSSEASVRAIKSRIRNKLMQSGSIGTNKGLKILKKNQLLRESLLSCVWQRLFLPLQTRWLLRINLKMPSNTHS